MYSDFLFLYVSKLCFKQIVLLYIILVTCKDIISYHHILLLMVRFKS